MSEPKSPPHHTPPSEAPHEAPERGSAALSGEEAAHADTGSDAVAAGEAVDVDVLQLKLDELRDHLSKAQMEAAEFKDRFLRAKAEAENTRRRAENEIRNTRKYAIEEFASEMLAVRDSLDLARNVNVKQDDVSAVEQMLEGLELTLKQMDRVFEKVAIRVVNPAPGDKLDPELHQAMSMQESSEVPSNHIISLVQKGYTLNDRLIRPAMVIVAKAMPTTAVSPQSDGGA